MLRIHRFDPTPCRFPTPRVPVLAPLERGALRRPAPAAGTAGRHWRHFARGRYALLRACELAGLDRGCGTLLVPSYHCRTMIDPALALGADVRLYPLHENLEPDIAALESLLHQVPAPRAVLATHFFGFAQDMGALAALCRRRDATLVEDASHVFFTDPALGAGPRLDAAIGRDAAIGIASPYKFMPLPEGGLLWTAKPDVEPRRPSWRDEIRAARYLATATVRKPRRFVPPAASSALLPAAEGLDLREDARGPSPRYVVADQTRGSLAVTRWLMRRCDPAAIVARRRARYAEWVAALGDVPGARPLYPALGELTVPYMFPLLLDAGSGAFDQLKLCGVPIWRWDELAQSDCAVAAQYRLRLLHLPCHQGLSDDQMAWLARSVRWAVTTMRGQLA